MSDFNLKNTPDLENFFMKVAFFRTPKMAALRMLKSAIGRDIKHSVYNEMDKSKRRKRRRKNSSRKRRRR